MDDKDYGRYGPAYLLRPDEPWSRADHDDQRFLLVAQDGIFVIEKNPLLTYARPVVIDDLLAICAQYGKAQIGKGSIALNARVPFSLFVQAVAFFRHIWITFHREDILLLYYNYEKGMYTLVHPPLLSADEGHVDYKIPETPEDAIRFGSFHAHGHEPAYHSSTDRRDDLNSPGLHCVFGHLDRPFTALACYWVADRCVTPVQPWDVFEGLQPSPFPEEWIVHVPVPKGRHGRSAQQSQAKGYQ